MSEDSILRINQQYAVLQSRDADIESLDNQILELNELLTARQHQRHEIQQHRRRLVVAIGRALAEHREQYGIGWRRDYAKHGLAMSRATAYRYIACAHAPEYCYRPSIDEWAAAAAKDAERRRRDEETESDLQREQLMTEECRRKRDADPSDRTKHRHHKQRRSEASKRQQPGEHTPEAHWRQLVALIDAHSAEYSAIWPHWLAVVAALRQGWHPFRQDAADVGDVSRPTRRPEEG